MILQHVFFEWLSWSTVWSRFLYISMGSKCYGGMPNSLWHICTQNASVPSSPPSQASKKTWNCRAAWAMCPAGATGGSGGFIFIYGIHGDVSCYAKWVYIIPGAPLVNLFLSKCWKVYNHQWQWNKMILTTWNCIRSSCCEFMWVLYMIPSYMLVLLVHACGSIMIYTSYIMKPCSLACMYICTYTYMYTHLHACMHTKLRYIQICSYIL